jgi:hypothetical protein
VKIGSYLIWAAVAAVTGLFVLVGYFIPVDLVPTAFQLRLLIMQWAVLLAAVGLFIGLANLFSVHWTKVGEQSEGWQYSAVLLIFFLITLMVGLVFGPDSETVRLLFNYVQLPVEATLSGLVAISLALAGFRIVGYRRDFISIVFVGTAFLVLIGSGPGLIPLDGPGYEFFAGLRNWIAQVAAAGGARGILIGVALGSVVTGLRVLLAIDRPYGDG